MSAQALMLFLLIGALAAPSRAEKPYVNIDCQKNTSTYAQQWCAGERWGDSSKELSQYLEDEERKEWEEATRTVCIKVWAPYIDGTGWKQGEVDCANRLNQTLIKEFKAFDNPEDSIWGN